MQFIINDKIEEKNNHKNLKLQNEETDSIIKEADNILLEDYEKIDVV